MPSLSESRFVGLVPAAYSAVFVAPSPSGSATDETDETGMPGQ
jgi:hypothetical protein